MLRVLSTVTAYSHYPVRQQLALRASPQAIPDARQDFLTQINDQRGRGV